MRRLCLLLLVAAATALTAAPLQAAAPAIVVKTPLAGQAVRSGGQGFLIAGTADVFEANVSFELLNAQGRRIARGYTTATCGTGCSGRFAARLRFHVLERQRGTLVVHDDDAAGAGHPPHSVRLRLVLLP